MSQLSMFLDEPAVLASTPGPVAVPIPEIVAETVEETVAEIEDAKEPLAETRVVISEDATQMPLFDGFAQIWVNEWKGMPEFVCGDLTSLRSIVVHFASEDDVQTFAQILGKKVYPATKYFWYPDIEIERYADKLYIDEAP